MAFLIPSNLKSRSDVTRGIQRTGGALEVALDEASTVWFEPLFDPTGQKPHFVVLIPYRGIVILEVMDVQRAKVLGAFRGRLRLQRDGREVEVENPLNRAKHFASVLQKRIASEPRLAGFEIPVDAGAVFPSTSREEATEKGLSTVLNLDECLFKPDLDAAIDGQGEARILKVFGRILGASKDIPKQVEKLLRGVIQPEAVIERISGRSSGQLTMFRASDDGGDVIRIMDRKQEAMAKTLGEGHRIIRGVAGSGKTLVLVYRAKMLASLWPNKPILVTCYTRSLAGQLKSMLAEHDNIEVVHLDRLMADVIRNAGRRHPGFDDETGDRVAEVALEALKFKRTRSYRAVLVDEAQDFGTPALKFALAMLEKGRDDVLIVADAAQNIFRRRFTWKQAGIQAQGRTQILRVNYRNTKEILEFAYKFLTSGSLRPDELPDLDDENAVIPPESAARSGSRPEVRLCKSLMDEIEGTIEQVKTITNGDARPKSIAVLYSTSRVGETDRAKRLYEALRSEDIGTFWLTDPGDRGAKDRLPEVTEPVVLSTIHSAKGLEFPSVILSGVWSDREDIETNRKLAYVGMTRASDKLAVVSHEDHPLANDLIKAAEE